MLLAVALLCHLVKVLKCSTMLHVNADAHQLKIADVDSSSTANHAHALPTQLPDVCPTSTSSTPKPVTVNACNNNNASVEQQLSTPLVVVLPSHPVLKVKDSTVHLADVCVRQLFRAVVEPFSMPTVASALPTQLPDVCPPFTDSTTTDVTVSASINKHACVALHLSMQPVLVLLSPTAHLLKHSTHRHAHAVAEPPNNADVDSFSALLHVLALLIQASPAHLVKDTTPIHADANAPPPWSAHVELLSKQVLVHAHKDQLLHAQIAFSTVRL
jgi:hypothetical protein